MADQTSSSANFSAVQQVPFHIHNGLDTPQIPFASIRDYTVSTDGTMAANSQTIIPTQSAVVTYVKAHTSPGGNGSDGALTITSGTTTIDCAGAAVIEKNYTSITISGTTSKLAFINPNAGGTTVILLSQGNISITSSNSPAIDLTLIGGTGGGGGNVSSNGGNATSYPAILDNSLIHSGRAGAGASGASAGAGAATCVAWNVLYRGRLTGPGTGGGGGGGGSNGTFSTGGVGGGGGTGGGTLILESGGSITIGASSTINLSGGNGTNGQGTGDGVHNSFQGGGGGGGGGGASGSFIATYTTTYTNSGTITINAGSGEAGGTMSVGGTGGSGTAGAGGGGGGGGATVTNGGSVGTIGGTGGGSANVGGNGGNGAIGTIYINQLA